MCKREHQLTICFSMNRNQNDYGGYGGPTSPCFKICAFVIVGICTLVFGGLGVFLLTSSINKQSTLMTTSGTIIGTSYCGCSSSGTTGGACRGTYAAIIQYFDEINEQTYTFTTDSCSNPAPTVGNGIKVLYDPNSPGRAFDGSFMGLWLAPLICLLVGFCLCCASSVFVLKACRNRTETKPPIQVQETATTPSQGWVQTPAAPSAPSSNPYSNASSSQPSSNANTNTGSSLFDQMNSKI